MYVLLFKSICYLKFIDTHRRQRLERTGKQTVSVFFIIYYFDVRHIHTNMYENKHGKSVTLQEIYFFFNQITNDSI